MKKYISRSEDETRRIGGEYSSRLGDFDVVAFFGELGSGKTQFIKGICSALGVKNVVNSPTFIIVNEYKYGSSKKIFHFDLYRIKTTDEILDIGFVDYLNKGLILIEWPELLKNILPDDARKVFLYHNGESADSRLIEIEEL